MVDLSQPAHPLEAQRHRLAVASDAGVRLRLPEWTSVLQVLAFHGCEARAFEALSKSAETQELTIRNSLPGEWLILGAGDHPHHALAEALDGNAALIDQSHGRIGIGLEGVSVRELLAKGTALDFHPDAFAIDRSTHTMFGHFAVHLTRTGYDSFELIVARSFVDSFFETLVETGREFGIAAYPRIRS